MHTKQITLGMMSLLLCAQTLAAGPLRFAANTSWSMPIARFDGERLNGGMMFDLGEALGAAVGSPVSYVPLPRKRIEGASLAGEIDVRCHINPQWTDAPDAYLWTEPLYELSDVIFGGSAAKPLRQAADAANGSVVSTVLGYRYPSLDPLFESGQLKREDTVDQEKVMLKITAARTPYGVTNNSTLDWYRRTTAKHDVADWKVVIATSAIHCAIPKASTWTGRPLVEALNSLKRNGKIEAMLHNYR